MEHAFTKKPLTQPITSALAAIGDKSPAVYKGWVNTIMFGLFILITIINRSNPLKDISLSSCCI